MVRQPLLVALLDGRPLLLEGRVINILEQAFKLCQVLEECSLRQIESLADEVAETGIALQGKASAMGFMMSQLTVYLVEPATRGN